MNGIKNATLMVSALLAVLLTATALTAGAPPDNTPAAEKANSAVVVEEGESIQAAINNASDGDRILVKEGTYEELLTIDGKDIKLVAAGDVTIKNPSPAETIADRQDTVMISNSNCTIEGFTINVSNGWGGIYAYGGPSYENGEVNVTIKDNKVTNYERNGITVNGELATGHIMHNNMVVGQKDSFWANNGIQIGWGATGFIKDNNVETNYWIGEDWTASGIMVFDAKNVSVTGNTVKDCETGIYVLGINNKVVNNNLEEELDEETWGIVIGNYSLYTGDWWQERLTYEESTNNKVIYNTITGYDYDIIDEGEDSKVHANVVR